MRPPAILRRSRTWLVGLPLVVLLVAVVGPFVYLNFIQEEAPDRLTLADSPATSTTAPVSPAGDLDGIWTVADGSQAGYRVKEVLFGQDAEAVGRTSDITGTLQTDGSSVTGAKFTVDLTTVTSSEGRRDRQFQGRIMDTATYPTAGFELTKPITVTSTPANGEQTRVSATGRFTIRGVTKSVTFDLTARRSGAKIEVNGTIPVVFEDYGIPDASFGPATVQDHGEIEFLLTFVKA